MYSRKTSPSAAVSTTNRKEIGRVLFILNCLYLYHGGWDGADGIATRHELDSPRIEFLWERDFPHPSRPVLGPIQSSVKWVPRLFFPGTKQTGRGVVYPHATLRG